MRIFCSLLGCKQAKETCACRRCGREMHDWTVIETIAVDHELVTRRHNTCVYKHLSRVTERCTRCGSVRERNRAELQEY